MVRKLLPILGRSLLVVIATLNACVSVDSGDGPLAEGEPPGSDIPVSSEVEKEKSGFSIGGLFGGKEKEKDVPEKPNPPSDPIPKKVPIGTVHLVHDQGSFVLIQTTLQIKIPPQAELMTYSQEGKPTGKLRISPERKGSFLVADILAGHPRANDRVMLFGMIGADGNMIFNGDPELNAEEVLE